MPINWEQLLNDYEIPYVTSGPNTRRGEISIKCPFCGDLDPSEHMGIGRNGWGCFRDSSHRGRSVDRLICILLGISSHQARFIEETYSSVDPDALGELGGTSPTSNEASPPSLPPSSLNVFEEIKPDGTSRRFWNYLVGRGFLDVCRVCSIYNIRAGTVGPYKDRIIIPVWNGNNSLAGWTARAIGQAKLRYLTSGPEVKRTIYNLPRLKGGSLLAVTEGPFDALKLDYYGVAATATFGTSFVPEQAALLAELSKLYTKTVILYDRDALAQAWALADWIPGASIGALPDGVKDPGDLSKEEVESLSAMYQSTV